MSEIQLKDFTDIQLIEKILRCDREILKMLRVEVENYPGAIMGLGDFYVEKSILVDELLRRKNDAR